LYPFRWGCVCVCVSACVRALFACVITCRKPTKERSSGAAVAQEDLAGLAASCLAWPPLPPAPPPQRPRVRPLPCRLEVWRWRRALPNCTCVVSCCQRTDVCSGKQSCALASAFTSAVSPLGARTAQAAPASALLCAFPFGVGIRRLLHD
jgi:hypothetical protein